MEKMKEQVGKMETQLQQWGATLDEIMAKGQVVGAEVIGDYHHHTDDLKAKYQVAQAKLIELRGAGKDSWGALKVDAEKVWNELEQALKKLTN